MAARLLGVLPASEALWYWNDTLRAASYLALSLVAVDLVPYANLRLKCALAALVGWSGADVVQCVLWYSVHIGGYRFASGLMLVGCLASVTFYWWRSYDQPSDDPEPSHLYCLRHRPATLQDFLISLAGVFGAGGGYAIYCRGEVYQFRRGRLVRRSYDDRDKIAYHCSRGAPATAADVAALDRMIGTRWRLLGANCITVLGAYYAGRRSR